jgi:DNA-binding response OmpR family regulator
MLVPTSSSAALREGVAAGADDFLPLPFPFVELLSRVQAWVASPV